jgi:hypothetical protein
MADTLGLEPSARNGVGVRVPLLVPWGCGGMADTPDSKSGASNGVRVQVPPSLLKAFVAQSVEHFTRKEDVPGSTPGKGSAPS